MQPANMQDVGEYGFAWTSYARAQKWDAHNLLVAEGTVGTLDNNSRARAFRVRFVFKCGSSILFDDAGTEKAT